MFIFNVYTIDLFFSKQILKSINFTVPPGQTYALVSIYTSGGLCLNVTVSPPDKPVYFYAKYAKLRFCLFENY